MDELKEEMQRLMLELLKVSKEFGVEHISLYCMGDFASCNTWREPNMTMYYTDGKFGDIERNTHD